MNYISERFVEANSTQYTLSIRLQADGFSFMARDEESLLALKERRLISEEDTLETLLLSEPMLLLPYRKCYIFVENKDKIIIPEVFFNPETVSKVFALSCPVLPGSTLVYNHVKSVYAYVVQAWDTAITSLVAKHFPTAKMVNELSAIGFNFKDGVSNSCRLLIDIHANHFNFIILENKELLFYNAFGYNTTTDIIYYILNTLQQVAIKEISDCYVTGVIPQGMAMLEKYIPNITYKGAEELMRLCNLNGKEQAKYINHLTMHECEL
ncbi:MAG: DUF3822 family protein [Marinifilaceae bacterium]